MSEVKKEKNTRMLVMIFLTIVFTIASGLMLVKLVNQKSQSKKEVNIVASNFVAYDFARAISGAENQNRINVEMLLTPGSEMHDYEPTPQDIAKLNQADLFIYNGGESEEWIEKLIDSSELDRGKTIRMMDLVDLKLESRGDEYDEHIWTSPKNAKTIVEKIKQKMIEKFPDFKESFEVNAGLYESELNDIDRELVRIISDAKRRELVFADRFPFLYLADDYGLEYLAAFPGCSEQTEASSATIASLIEKINKDQVDTVLKIELTSDKLAKTVAEATGAKIMTLNSAHNISEEDFKNGIRFVDIMRDNLVVLAEALN